MTTTAAAPTEPTPKARRTPKALDPAEVERKRAEKAVLDREVARIAHETGRPRPEVRKAIQRARKALARTAAIEAASGPRHALPVVVDRAGTITDLDVETAAAVIASCTARSGVLTVDVETTGYPYGHRRYRLRTVQLGDAGGAVVLDPDDPAQREVIAAALVAAPALHAHSGVADLVPLADSGLVDYAAGWSKMYDTVIPAKLADPSSTGSDPSLKRLSDVVLRGAAVSPAAESGRAAVFAAGGWLKGKQRFLDQLTLEPERNGWTQIDSTCEAMIRYAASDVLDTAALARSLPPVPGEILRRERIAEDMTARVGYRGLRIDAERLAELTLIHRMGLDAAAARVREFGIENPGSNDTVAAVLTGLGATLPLTEKGKPSVADHALSILVRHHGDTAAGRLAKAMQDFKHHRTAMSLFLAPYEALCTHGDGRLRPTVYTLGTDTGRMSAVRPNIQQLPREGGIRSIVCADEGEVLISADFSGVELRGAAALSQDPTMMAAIAAEDAFDREVNARAALMGASAKAARAAILAERGWENAGQSDGFHWMVARAAFGSDATKADRYLAKRGVFGFIYGGGLETLAKQLGITLDEMAKIVEALRELTPGLSEWSNAIRLSVRNGHTQFPAYSGRVIHFPREFPHKAPNYAIQGSCRELLIDALLKWRDTRWGNATVVPVHDELIVAVPREDAEVATATLMECMTSSLYGVEIRAEADPAENYWQDSA